MQELSLCEANPRTLQEGVGAEGPHPPPPSCAPHLPSPAGNWEAQGRLGLNAASSRTWSQGEKTPRKRREGESCGQGQPPQWGGGPDRLLEQGLPWVPNSRQTAFLILQPLPS